MPFSPEVTAYQHALQAWEKFHAETTRFNLGDRLVEAEFTPVDELAEVLRVLPAKECEPVTFGLFLRASHDWRPSERDAFLGEFLAQPPGVVSRILAEGERDDWKSPMKHPVTLEEYPSRIWKRAIASGRPCHIIMAGHLAVRSMIRLFFIHEVVPENTKPDLDTLRPGESAWFSVPSGDLPPEVDLLGIPPFTLPELKGRVLDRLMTDAEVGAFIHSKGQDTAFPAWVFADTEEGPARLAVVLRETEEILGRLKTKRNLADVHHACRLGRLLFRLGCRSEAMRCAKAVGAFSPWDQGQGWQFQVLTRAAHTRIRNQLLIIPGVDADGWKTEPALACSAVSLPLWLKDPVNQVAELIEIFNQAATCPWVFPNLFHVFQWHLALCGKQEALGKIEALAPDWVMGLHRVPSALAAG